MAADETLPERPTLYATHGQTFARKDLLPDARLFTVDGFLSRDQCLELITFAEEHGWGTVHQPRTGDMALRQNDRILLQDASLADEVWAMGVSRIFASIRLFRDPADGFPKILPEGDRRREQWTELRAVGLNRDFRLYRYRASAQARFGQHYDDTVDTDLGPTCFTLLWYLNDAQDSSEFVLDPDCDDGSMCEPLEGGETVFEIEHAPAPPKKGKKSKAKAARERIVVTPRTGSLLSHVHGYDCLLHEGAPVRRGVKYLLRTDVVYE